MGTEASTPEKVLLKAYIAWSNSEDYDNGPVHDYENFGLYALDELGNALGVAHDPLGAQEVARILEFGGFTRKQAEAALDIIRWAGYRIVEDKGAGT